MATTNNAHSDLIHLFIDGEATETERNILFGALKDSPELQEEFSSAMQLKQAFAADISKLQPPSYLQSQIAERAGLIVVATSSLATAPVVVNSVSSAISSIAPIAATGISKGLMTLLVGTAVGVLSTVGIIQLTKESPKAVDRRFSIVDSRNSIPQTVENQVPTTERQLPTIDHRPSTIDNRLPAIGHRLPTIDHPSLRSAAPLPVLHLSKASLNEKGSVIEKPKEIANSVVNDRTPSQSETVTNVNTNTTNSPAIAENISAESLMAPISSADPMIPMVKNVGSYSPNHSPFYDGSDGFMREPDWMARFSVALQGMPTAKLYQGQSDNATVPPWNNYGWALKYEFNPFEAVAVEGGLETFPVYLVNSGGGGLTGHHSIGWGGVSYTLSFPFAEVLGIHPEVRGLAGMSTAGPIAKLSAGFVFQPAGQFSFSVDPEYTALFIKENGAVRAGSKLGLTYSVRFHF